MATKEDSSSTIAEKEGLWENLPTDLLCDICTRVFAADRAGFSLVCKSWNSASLLITTPRLALPLKELDPFSPYLLHKKDQIFHPVRDELHHMSIPDIPEMVVVAARDGWLLMSKCLSGLFIFNPFTKEQVTLPYVDSSSSSFYFSAPPKSANCVVVLAARSAIYYMKWGEETWACFDAGDFNVSSCNAIGCKGLYYFLGTHAELLIFDPKKEKVYVNEAPKLISELIANGGQQYMLESDGKVLAVFVSMDGSLVYTCQWNPIEEDMGNTREFG